MIDRPKFRRKFRKDAPLEDEDDSAPVAPLERRADRIARRKAEEEAEALRAAEEARARAEAAEAEMQRQAASQEAERRAMAEEARLLAERETAEQAAEEEARRRAVEDRKRAEAKRQAEEQEAARRAEKKRLAEQAAQKVRDEADRLEAEALEIAHQEAQLAEARALREAERERQKKAYEDRQRAKAEAKRKADEQAKLEAEAKRERDVAEAARLAKIEAQRQEDERRAKAEAQRLDEERKARERAERLASEQRAQADRAKAKAPLELTSPVLPARPKRPDVEPVTKAAPAKPEPVKSPSAWDRLGEFELNEAHLAANRIITARREDPAYTAFDVLRTRLLQALNEHGWKRVAITSPTKDCGKTFTAANLAISLSRQENFRTLLLDCDMRRPTLQKVMGVAHAGSMGDMLRGKISPEDHLRRLGRNTINAGRNIAFGFNQVIEPYASELLQDPRTEATLDKIEATLEPDVMLFDLPPALYYDDVIAFRPMFDGVLLVIGGGITTEKEIKEVERRLGDETPLLGMVLNKAENTQIDKYHY